jgi:hypothetical protein
LSAFGDKTRTAILGLVLALAASFASAVVRVRAALADPHFDAVHSEGLLKSDPALLVYLTERILESGGSVPEDFARDPRIEFPSEVDVPARFPIAQEFGVAWAYRAFGRGMPLHVFCLWAAAVSASLVLVGVYLLVLELGGSAALALLAALLAGLVPANYRTMGFVLMDEDFSLPFFALHLALIARAWRVRTITSVVLAAIALGCALATWHATSFFAALEALCVFAWCVRTNTNPFEFAPAWIFLAVLVAFALCVPFLRETLFVTSAPMILLGALAIASRIPFVRAAGLARRVLVSLALAVSLALLSFAVARATGSGQGEYGHVFELLAAKVEHFGVLPEDPSELSFDARLMWQGPFATLDLGWGAGQIGIALLAFVPAAFVAVRGWRAPREDPLATLVSTLAWISLPTAWLVARAIVLPGMLAPVLAIALASRWFRARERDEEGSRAERQTLIVAGLAIAVQAALFSSWIRSYSNPWYAAPVQRQAEIAALVRALPALVPEGEAIASDSMNSSAILLHTRHPILFQPKWESRASRARVEDFLRAFFESSPLELRSRLGTEYRTRYLVVDRFTLWYLSRYAAGVPPSRSEPNPGTAAAAFLSQDQHELENVPGWRLLYRSPQDIRQSNGAPTDFFRVYRADP